MNQKNEIFNLINENQNITTTNLEERNGFIIIYKIGIIIILFFLSFIFGYLPIKISYFTTNYKLIGIANSFSGGIFLCVALMHLLPESTEIFNEYFEENSHTDGPSNHENEKRHFPFSFLLSFVGYTVILMIEKIIFDAHSHHSDNEIEENKNDSDHEETKNSKNLTQIVNLNLNVKVNNNYNVTINKKNETQRKKSSMNSSSPQKIINNIISEDININKHTKIHTRLSSNPSSVSILSKGKRDKINEYFDTFKNDTVQKNEEHFKNLFSNKGKISFIILENDIKIKTRRKRESEISISNHNLSEELINHGNDKINEDNKSIDKDSTITSYLLLLALSIHACFEGIAIGLQGNTNEIFYMFLAISFHKWVEALSIGINLNNSKIERSYLFNYILLFSLMTPLGIVLGIIFSGFSNIIEAIFLSISSGSFIYISASEVVIEEFSVSKYKKEKFFGFICGALIICILTIFEHHD